VTQLPKSVDDDATDTLGEACPDKLGLINPLRKKPLAGEVFLEATFTGAASSITFVFELYRSLDSFGLKGSPRLWRKRIAREREMRSPTGSINPHCRHKIYI
jgi:hypothetical protein